MGYGAYLDLRGRLALAYDMGGEWRLGIGVTVDSSTECFWNFGWVTESFV